VVHYCCHKRTFYVLLPLLLLLLLRCRVAWCTAMQ
jgi:hypothetical protein